MSSLAASPCLAQAPLLAYAVPKPWTSPCLPYLPGLSEWLQHQGLPASVLVVPGLIWYEVKAGEARQVRRSDELRADMKEGFAQCRADNRALAEKVDRLVASLLTARQS